MRELNGMTSYPQTLNSRVLKDFDSLSSLTDWVLDTTCNGNWELFNMLNIIKDLNWDNYPINHQLHISKTQITFIIA